MPLFWVELDGHAARATHARSLTRKEAVITLLLVNTKLGCLWDCVAPVKATPFWELHIRG